MDFNFYEDMKSLKLNKKEYLRYVEHELEYGMEYDYMDNNEEYWSKINKDKIKELEENIILESDESVKKYLKKMLKKLYDNRKKYNLSTHRINKKIRQIKRIEGVNNFLNSSSIMKVEILSRNKKISI